MQHDASLGTSRVRGRDLPHGTFVRDAVVLVCPPDPTGDAAVRFAAREAALRRTRLVVVASFGRPVDPDLESIEIPDAELRRRARVLAESTLCRALGRPLHELPTHEIVTEPGETPQVLLRDYRDAALVVASVRGGLLHRLGAIWTGEDRLARRCLSPLALVPGGSVGQTGEVR